MPNWCVQLVTEEGCPILPMKTGRVAKPLLKVELPEIPPEPIEEPEANTQTPDVQSEAEDKDENA